MQSYLLLIILPYWNTQYLIKIRYNYIFQIVFFPNNVEIIIVDTLRKTQHIIPSIQAILYAYILSATLRSILYSVLLIHPPIFCASSGFLFSSTRTHLILPWPVLLFYTTTLAVIYTVCIYFTARRKTSRPPPNGRPSPLGTNVITASEPVVACTGWL